MRNGLPPFAVLPGPIASTGVDIPRGQSAGWLGSAFTPWYRSRDLAALDFDGASTSLKTPTLTMDGRASAKTVSWRAGSSNRACGVVTVNMFDTVFNRVTWDCHGAAPFSTLDDYASELLPTFDQAFTALIDDLERRGRLETTLVIAAGEFGRTPRINASGGRDHWPGVWSVVLAGGGVRGGQVVGASDAHAAEPGDRPVTPEDLLATMYYSLGIDATRTLFRPDGTSISLVENGTPVRELFG